MIKYAYIADLAYAQTHGGQSFTGVEWRFHKFGPWSSEIYERLEPALSVVGITRTETSHPKYEEECAAFSEDVWKSCASYDPELS